MQIGMASMLTENYKSKLQRLEEWLRAYWLYIPIYLFFLYVSSTSARAGDDWALASWYNGGFVQTLAGMIRATTYVNGRVVANLSDAFFAHYDNLWRIAMPAIFTSIIYLSARLFGYARRPIPVLFSFLLFLCVSDGIRIETYVWLIGNVGYITVIPLILLYLNIIQDAKTAQEPGFWQHDTTKRLLIGLLAFVIGLWVENITLGFLAGNLLLAALSYIRTRRVSPDIWYGIGGTLLSLLVLFGTPARAAAAPGLEVGLRARLIQNVAGIMKIVVVDNNFIYLLFCIVFIVLVATGRIGPSSKVFRIVAIAVASFVALTIVSLIVLQIFLKFWYMPVGNALTFVNNTFFQTQAPLAFIYCLAILLLILLAIVLSPAWEMLLVLYGIGMVSALAMAPAPYLGARIFSLAVFSVILVIAALASRVQMKSGDFRRLAVLVLAVAVAVQMEKFFYYGEYTEHVQNMRLQLIANYRTRLANGLASKDEWLVLPAYSTNAVNATGNPGVYDFHMAPLKSYYDLPPDAQVVIDTPYAIKTFAVTQVSGLEYHFEITPLDPVSEYTYQFIVRKNNSMIYHTVRMNNNFVDYKFPGPGEYTVSCNLIQNGLKREVRAPQPVEIGEN